jgi:PAS domain S-box-containing protein
MAQMDSDQTDKLQNHGMDHLGSIQNLHRTAIILLVLLLIYAAFVTWYSWTDEKSEKIKNLATITELESKAINSYFRHLEIDLIGLAGDLTQKGERIDLDFAYVTVKRFKDFHPELYNVTLIQSDGNVLLTARNAPGTSRATLAKEPSFIKFIEELKQGKGFSIGQPLVSVVTKTAIVPIRFPIRNSQGDLIYIVSANLPHEHLRSFWMNAPITSSAAIGLMRDNGYLLSRYPAPANLTLDQIYGQPRTGALIKYLQQREFPDNGFVQGPSSLDGPDFLNAFQRLKDYPVTLFIAMPMSDIREAWWKRVSGTYLALLFLFLAGIATYRFAVHRQYAWIKEQKRLEDARHESEAHLNNAQRIAHLGSWEWDVVSGVVQWSVEQYRIMGFEPGACTPSCDLFFEVLHPDDHVKVKNALDQTLKGNASYNIECRILLGDKTIKYVQSQGRVERDADGNPSRMTGTLLDITERKQAEILLRESEGLFRIMADTAPVLIWVSGKDKLCYWFNQVWLDFTGRTMEQEMGNGWAEGVHPDDFQRCLDTYVSAFDARREFSMEYRLRRHDGEYRWLVDNGVPRFDELGTFLGYIGSCIDISDRKLATDALQESEEKLRLSEGLMAASEKIGATGSWVYRIETNDIWGSAEALRIFGYPPIAGLFPIEDIESCIPERVRVHQALEDLISKGRDYNIEYQINPKDGSLPRTIHSVAKTEKDAQGNLLSVLGFIQDVTEQRRLGRERDEALDRLQKIASRVPGVVYQFRLRPDGTSCFPFASSALNEIYRVTPEEVVKDASKVFANIHPDDLDGVLSSIQKSASDLSPWRHDYRVSFQDGTERWVTGNSIPEREADGAILWHGYIADISERVQTQAKLANALEEQEAILQSEVVGFSILRNRVFTWANPATAKMLGYGDDEIVGLSCRNFYQDDEHYEEFGREAYSVIKNGQVFRTQVQWKRKDGSLGWFDVSGADLRPDTGESIWAFVNISEQKHTELELVNAKEAAEAANIAKSRFLATMSHEIRTPMNGILGMAQMLLSPKLEDSERQDYARTVLNSGHTLLTLLNDILDLSKVEAGKVQLESIAFDPAQIIQETKTLFRETAAGKELNIVAGEFKPPSQRYLGDPYRLRQMISNLVGNAIKFTKEGQISIQVQEIKRDGQTIVLEFSVADTGIGITEDQRKILFKPFSQADSSTTRKFGGTGLGLSIVSSLAKLMGGEAGVESELGHGSRFWFRIQAKLVEAGQDSRQSERRQQPGTSSESQLIGRVLVAEDNLTNRKVAEALLNKIGLTATFAKDGQEALDAITQGDTSDLILMDVHMPIMDGYIATEKIRQWETEQGKPRRPIIALTADAYEADHQHCLAAGMDEFLAKPIAIEKLRQVLSRWLPAVSSSSPDEPTASPQTKSLDTPRVIQLLKELRPLLEQNRFDAIHAFNRLKEVASGTEIAQEIAGVGKLMDECLFSETLDRLLTIAKAHQWDIGP